jgi:hypothetical protein
MNRRKPKRRAARFADSLIVVNIAPTVGVVNQLRAATAEARELAMAKRAVERALRDAGMPKSTAVRVLARMSPADVLFEAAKLAPQEPAQEPAAAPAPTTPPRPWWRFWRTP